MSAAANKRVRSHAPLESTLESASKRVNSHAQPDFAGERVIPHAPPEGTEESALKRARPNSHPGPSIERVMPHAPPEAGESGILNERVLALVLGSMNWDIHALCTAASVNRKLRAVAKRLLWRELCLHRAPRMASTIASGANRVGGGWHALAKLLFSCPGCSATRNFRLDRAEPGHFSKSARFSKTSGRSFLARPNRSDLLYVSDPCEHVMSTREDDLGVFRGVFRGFMRSKTRASLIRRSVGLEEGVTCPYCGARAWSMTSARLVPKSAARRLGSRDGGGVEYFVCVNGHLHGACWLVPLSSDEEEDDDVDGGDGEVDSDGGDCGECDDRTATTDGSTSTAVSSAGEEIGGDDVADY